MAQGGAIIALSAQDIPVGFAEVYHSEFPGLVRLAVLLTSDPDQGRDIVQDAFVHAISRWSQLDDPTAYLRRSVVNGATDLLRRRRRAGALTRRIAAATPSTTEPAEYLADAIASLVPQQRTAVVLKFHLDLTTAEIADAMGIRAGSVGPTLTRALRRLRQEMTP